jgi:hypothetical protein
MRALCRRANWIFASHWRIRRRQEEWLHQRSFSSPDVRVVTSLTHLSCNSMESNAHEETRTQTNNGGVAPYASIRGGVDDQRALDREWTGARRQ